MVIHGEAAWICLMCCNADRTSLPFPTFTLLLTFFFPVLFSVLVLHWVTSKDSSITIPILSSGTLTNTHHTSYPNHKSSKHEPLDMYGRSSDGGIGTITTHTTAAKLADDEASEKSDIEIGNIVVEVGQVVERKETEEEVDTGRRSHRSTEDLVERMQWPMQRS